MGFLPEVANLSDGECLHGISIQLLGEKMMGGDPKKEIQTERLKMMKGIGGRCCEKDEFVFLLGCFSGYWSLLFWESS